MILVGNTLISLDVLEEEFVCNINQCKGSCCIDGDYGAPLNEDDISAITRNIESIKPYMTADGLQKLEESSFYEEDPDLEMVTQCLSGRECLFAINEKGIYKCAIEKAFIEKKSDYRKPISCYLYPIRLGKVGEYITVNYDRWSICNSACQLGKSLKVPLYKFLKEPLIQHFGTDWYSELEEVAEEYLKSKK